MKQSKWFKWQVGMIASVTAAFLFHEVKASPSFEQATLAVNNSTTDTTDSSAVGTEDYMDRWASQTTRDTGRTGRNSISSSDTSSHSKTGRS